MKTKQIDIESISEFTNLINELDSSFFFRGHSDSKWGLETSFERIIGNRFESKKNSSIEDYLRLEFKSKFHLYDNEGNYIPSSDLEWLSLMQHYGVPTRLLDFTQSPYVALYFALENYILGSNTKFSVIGINWKTIQTLSSNIIKRKFKDFNTDQFCIYRNSDLIYDQYLKDEDIDVVWFSEPNILNKRLDLQMGSFLFSSNPGIKLLKLLDSKEYSSVEKVEYIFTEKIFKKCYDLLIKMNINGKTVYGDLNGLGISLKDKLKSLSIV